MAKICGVPVSISKMAQAADLEVKPTIDGRWRIFRRSNKSKVATVSTELEAREAINRFVGEGMPDLDASVTIPVRGTPLSQTGATQQSQLTVKREFISTVQVGFAARFFTPAKQFMQAVERSGHGPAFTKIYQVTQVAMGKFNEAIAFTTVPVLKGMFGATKKGGEQTFQEAAKKLDKLFKSFTPEQRRLATLHSEHFTKQELARPGVLLEEGMDATNIALADGFSALGVAEDIPSMIRTNAIIDDFLSNRKDMIEVQIPKMENAILEGRLPPEFSRRIQGMLDNAGTETTADDLMKIMGISAEEVEGMQALRTIIDNEDINIPAIYRYATAEDLKPGFKNGREQFAATRGMLPEVVKLSNQRMTLIQAAFDRTGASASQVVGAQYPIFREFISAGVLPGNQFGNSSRGAVKRWARVLQDLPEGDEILKRRVLSGHLDPHELNPAVTALRHIRNILLREHFDPVMPGAMAQLHAISNRLDDPRIGKIIENYLHELEGIPNESFKALTAMVRSMGRFANFQVDDRIADRLVNTLNFFTYSASIPFRVGLIARNYFQTTLALPIVGPEAWWAGIKSALGETSEGFSREAMAAAKLRAIKGNALKVNVVPLHGGTEAIGGVGEGIFGQLRPELARAGFSIRELFDRGFSAYRNGDDFGRVVAFEAGRFRVNKHLGKYMKSGRSADDLEAFKIASKVKTFDETVEAQFEKLIVNGQEDAAADLIGKELADKVHFLYGDANHPPGWGTVPGRLFGQFGTFPIQYANHVVEGLTRGTKGDIAMFAAGHTAVNLSIVSAGAQLFDADLASWAFLPSLQYTGGPYAEILLSSVAVVGGSDAERSLALRNIQMMLPWWNRPSIFVPGSYFLNDVFRAFDEDDFATGLARASGVRFLHDEPSALDEAFQNIRSGFGWVNEIITDRLP